MAEEIVNTIEVDNGTMIKPDCAPELKPYVGQRFLNIEDGISFYKQYARTVGFDVRRSAVVRFSNSKGLDEQNIYRFRYVVCKREGRKNEIEVNRPVKRRLSYRCSCPAHISLKYDGLDGYVVSKFVEEHNHELIHGNFKVFMRSNRQLEDSLKDFMVDCFRVSIGPTQTHNLLCELLGGKMFVGSTVLEARNFSRDVKAFVEGADAQVMLNRFKKMKEVCELFSYDYEVDEDGRMVRLFWADSISQTNYRLFGDVVSFDTTYSTNKYCMIFAPFTGKDNHGRPVTFASGLINREDADSFIWLFNKFVNCMGVPPNLIITDQDLGMKVAVQKALSSTRHRWCMWHIMVKLSIKIHQNLRMHDNKQWRNIVENEWLNGLFEDRTFWIPAYFRDFEMSGLLRTTSLSESENSFYKRFTKARSNLLEFMGGFNNAIECQRHHSDKLDFADNNKVPNFATDLGIEKHASSFYTLYMFNRVQEEIKNSGFGCNILDMSTKGDEAIFKIEDHMGNIVNVMHRGRDEEYSCSCNMFIIRGYACSHLFFVFRSRRLKVIPEKFLKLRWAKSSISKSSYNFQGDYLSNRDVNDAQRIHNNILTKFFSLLHMIKGDEDLLSSFSNELDELGVRINSNDLGRRVFDKNCSIEKFYGEKIPEEIEVLPPNVVKTKGSGSRLICRQESWLKKKDKPKRRCAKCNELAHHDSRNCPSKDVVSNMVEED